MKLIVVNNRTASPSKIVCIGRNYVEHIVELNNEIAEEMVVFLKPNSAITEELHSYNGEQLHYEAELCLMYENARFSAIGFGLDITKRALQNKLKSKGLPWERAKAFNGSALFSPFVEVSEISQNLSVELDIDGENVQSSSIDKMIYKPEQILTELLTFMSFNNGDIVMTGTPKGVGAINKAQQFVGRIKENGEVITSVCWNSI